jgi:hypothetical protein
MTPPPRCRLAVAPRFHLAPDWAARLSVGAGVREEGGRFFPHGPWRPMTADELNLFISAPEHGPEGSPEAGWLFQIPGHLRAAWWDLLDRSVGAGAVALPGFEDFAGQVAEFLRFKQMDVPPGIHMEAVVAAAGRCSMRSDPATGAPSGMGPSLAPWAACAPPEGGRVPQLWAAVNLGDEGTWLVLIAIPIPGLAANLASRDPGRALPATVGELARLFLREFPGCLPVRLRLGPGEGFRLPSGGLILDGDATDKQEPDVVLLISEHPPD